MRKRKKKTKKSLVDIIIPVYGRFDLLTQCLESIPEAAGTIPYSITIIDNNSPDIPDKFYSQFPDVEVSINGKNEGFIRACNRGERMGSAPLVFFLNSDVILEPGSIDQLVRSMDDPKVGIVGMKLLFPNPTQLHESKLNPDIRPANKVQHVGLTTNIRGEVVHVFIGWSSDSKKVNSIRDVMAVTGAALMVRRPLFRRVGGFDKDFGQGTYEDVSLCMEIRKIGYNVIVNPEAVGTHFVGASSEAYQAQFPLNQNYRIFVDKWRNDLKQWDYNIL